MADDKIEEMIEEEQKDTIEDNKERTTHLDMINKQIDQANLLARIRNDFSKNVEKICGLMNELHDEIYSDHSWLRLVELNKINVLIDEALDYVWRSIYGKNREKHERINIDKDKDIDGHVSKYNIIVNVKLELMNIIGELINSAMIEVQNEVGMINDVKHASEIEIDALKLLYSTLAKILKKWRDAILGMINSDNVCNKPDNNKKDNKPDTKKKDNKPDTKMLDTKKKDNKPDTSINSIENRVSNRIRYEIQDISKYKKVLIKMIGERMHMLDLMNMWLEESVENTDIYENMYKFNRLCHDS